MTTPSEESPRPAFAPGVGSPQGRPPAGPSRGFGGPARSGPSADRGARPAGGRRFYSRRKVCFFCANKDIVLNYKAVDGLRRYISERGRIEPRRKTGTCARHQRTLAVQIKRARQIALLPFTTDRPREYPQSTR